LSATRAQLVIARENGFASWLKLKAHVDAGNTAIDLHSAVRPISPMTLDRFWQRA